MGDILRCHVSNVLKCRHCYTVMCIGNGLFQMIKQMWPYIGDYVKKLIKETIEPICENSMPASLRPFKFDCIDMGDTVSIMGTNHW